MAGVVPTMVRAMVVNMLQVGGYDVAKTNIKTVTGIDGVGLHITSALSAGFVYSLATLPIDLAKTRMQVGRGRECESEGGGGGWRGATGAARALKPFPASGRGCPRAAPAARAGRLALAAAHAPNRALAVCRVSWAPLAVYSSNR